MFFKNEIDKIKPIVKKINAKRESYVNMSDKELKNQTDVLRERLFSGEPEEKVMIDAFAVVREASRRAINKEHYDVQLLSGIILFQGRVSEAKTGEGKTITIFLPAYLEALKGDSVYVVTVNDYLAERDATEASRVFEMLGLTVGFAGHDKNVAEKQKAYKCDITYVTNSELGFDYLKDNLVKDKADRVLRGLNYAIVDEVDSILIDEARTPLIISGKGPQPSMMLKMIDHCIKQLERGEGDELSKMDIIVGREKEETGDYIMDEKKNQIYLTDAGFERLEKLFGSPLDTDDMELQRIIKNSLRANFMMKRDKDYIIDNGKVEIVDEHTGRVLHGRRYSNGLHQAVEAKEGVEVQTENLTIASITYQNFFNKFKKKAGLTGTAKTEEKEFQNIYSMDVVEIPTNKPVIRIDNTDYVFKTKEEKWDAVVEDIKRIHATGQPILVGTTSVEDSELLSEMLKANDIEHNVLNAKNHKNEAEIVARAGVFNAVTVSTNMAGRGTDILLDDKARECGGLYVIGTERHDSRRIDNQLIGRSGRQGDPGETRFYLSLDDKLMRVFGNKDSLNTLMMMTVDDGEPLEFKQLAKIISKAQKAIETEHFLTREALTKYDETDSQHREEIYKQRDRVLETEDLTDMIKKNMYDLSDHIVDKHVAEQTEISEAIVQEILLEYRKKFRDIPLNIDSNGKFTVENLKHMLRELSNFLLGEKTKEMVAKQMYPVVKEIVDRNVDEERNVSKEGFEIMMHDVHAFCEKVFSADMFDKLTVDSVKNMFRNISNIILHILLQEGNSAEYIASVNQNIERIGNDVFVKNIYDASDNIIDKNIHNDEEINADTMHLVVEQYYKQLIDGTLGFDCVGGLSELKVKRIFQEILNMLFANVRSMNDEMKHVATNLSNSILKQTILRMIDRNWSECLSNVEYLRDTIGNVQYAQKDPVNEYRIQGLEVFNGMIWNLKKDMVFAYLNCNVEFN